MRLVYMDRMLRRLEQILDELRNADRLHYEDRLRAFKRYCDSTSALANCLAQLPHTPYNFKVDWRDLQRQWPEGEEGYAYRWDAIRQIVEQGPGGFDLFCDQIATSDLTSATIYFTEMFVVPLYNYLVDQLEAANAMLYLLLRYKRWVEWFESRRLREAYNEAGRDGEAVLDEDVRRFLFESGVDYPYSQPRSPGGQVDVVAGLETEDPLVLEIKVWDSRKGYRENRVRDGLRQVVDYAGKYGKDRGYIVVFNLDTLPLIFVGEVVPAEWPARIERGGVTYYFIAVDLAEQKRPPSQRDKGKPVKTNRVELAQLWDDSWLGDLRA